MIYRVKGVVDQITFERPGLQELTVKVVAPELRNDADSAAVRSAINYTDLNGPVLVGDYVELNTVAVELNLGTGGFDFVSSVIHRDRTERSHTGHILKLRYTPLQFPILAVESPESPNHEAVRAFSSLDSIPVVCFELHSQLPAICYAINWALNACNKRAVVAYIMSDGASLPIALSHMVGELKSRGLVDATVTAGQCFGGDVEAVNIYSAMAAAHSVVKADVIIIGPGPGTVGTDTALGFSGIDQGLAVNAAASLGGQPIFVPRISFCDERSRHVGLSHHSITNLKTVVRAPTMLPIPRLPTAELKTLHSALESSGIASEHDVITVDADLGLMALIESGLKVSTMGRDLNSEKAFFLAAAAAGLLAAQLVEARRPTEH